MTDISMVLYWILSTGVTWIAYISAFGFIAYIAIYLLIGSYYLLVGSFDIIQSCIKFPWNVIISFLKIRQINNQAVLLLENFSGLYNQRNEFDVFPLEKMVILRQIEFDKKFGEWSISIILPIINSEGRLQFNKSRMCVMGKYDFIVRLFLQITGFRGNFKIPSNLTYRYDYPQDYSMSVDNIRIPKLNKFNFLDKLRYKASMRVAELIYENIRLEQEIEKIKKQQKEINKVFKLITQSENYENHEMIYAKALADIDELLSKADELNATTHSYIKEILIDIKLKTNEVSVFQNTSVTDKYLSIEAQHLQLKGDYENLRYVSSNYDKLLNMATSNK